MDAAFVAGEGSKLAQEDTKTEFIIGQIYCSKLHCTHALLYKEDGALGWACDGKQQVGGCKSDLFGGRDEKTCKRFHCATDNFDLCEKCMLASYTTDRIVSMRFAEGLYEGFVNSNNQKHGKGKFEFISKVVYIGEYFNNVRQGYGEMFYTNGDKYEGNYDMNSRHGKGKYTSKAGDYVFNGDWVKDKRTGFGRTDYVKGGYYEGGYFEGLKSGHGKFVYSNNSVYEGNFDSDKKSGLGKLVYVGGGKYEGNFVNDQRSGFGKHVMKNLDVYEGAWVADKREGFGEYFYKTGAKYKGNYKDNAMSGYGEYIFPNGDHYEGDWLANKQFGKGKLTRKNGVVFHDGLWENGTIVNKGIVITSTLAPSSFFTFKLENTNGKLTLQESREYAASKDCRLPSRKEVEQQMLSNNNQPLFDQEVWFPLCDDTGWASVGTKHKVVNGVAVDEKTWSATSVFVTCRTKIALLSASKIHENEKFSFFGTIFPPLIVSKEINSGIPVHFVSNLINGERVYMVEDMTSTTMVLENGNTKTFNGPISRFDNREWDYYANVSQKYLLDFPTYEGPLENGKRKGEGKLKFKNGMFIEGMFDKDQLVNDSKVKVTFPCAPLPFGNIYECNLIDGKLSGEAKITNRDGTSFEGTLVDNKKEGQGKFIYLSGAVYEGSWENDYRHGLGKQTFANGDFYEGNWFLDQFSGEGKFKKSSSGEYYSGLFANDEFVSGEVFLGEFDKDGKYSGFGKMLYKNGDSYSGFFNNGLYEGNGTLITKDGGDHYVGDFLAGKMEGNGRLTSLLKGEKYEGDFMNNMKNGKGIMTWSNGDVYEGNFKDDKKCFEGKFNFADGNLIYEGEWLDDLKNGYGKLTISTGEKYEGNWKNDKKHGVGTFKFANNDVYEGEWYENRRHGKGKQTLANGEIFHEGEWKDNKKVKIDVADNVKVSEILKEEKVVTKRRCSIM